jgi:tetratricopeptide (TPR) repeat protein
MRRIGFFSAVLIAAALLGCGKETKQQPTTEEPPKADPHAGHEPAPADPGVDKSKPPLLKGLGSHSFQVTANEQAKPYFDQALVLAYAFNHAEAERSFLYAATVDPACAMCFWGASLVLGPNYNAPIMDPASVPKAWDALQKALAVADKVTEKERDLIQALTKRYAEKPPEKRTELDEAYANAMREVAKKYPEDADVQTLAAEAMMDLHPWNLWQRTGEALPWTAEITTILEGALKLSPDHPGANHLYIHAVEASPEPGRAEASADRLNSLVPGAGHLVHMPAHIYLRTGRYADASAANERAVASDNEYFTQCAQQGIYPLIYHPHNFHFMFVTRTLEGRSADAMAAANKVKETGGHPDMMKTPGLLTLQHYHVMPIYGMLRFGKWDDILALPAFEEELVYPRSIYHYARGMAFRAQGKADEAAKELEEVKKLAVDPRLEKVTIWDLNPAKTIVLIGQNVLEGELAALRKDYNAAIPLLQKAVEHEDSLAYNEPPDWYYPARHNLGAVLLEAGKAKDAEAVFTQELRHFPENGWSLFGLLQSLKAQGKSKAKDVEAVQKRLDKAWANADIQLTTVRI